MWLNILSKFVRWCGKYSWLLFFINPRASSWSYGNRVSIHLASVGPAWIHTSFTLFRFFIVVETSLSLSFSLFSLSFPRNELYICRVHIRSGEKTRCSSSFLSVVSTSNRETVDWQVKSAFTRIAETTQAVAAVAVTAVASIIEIFSASHVKRAKRQPDEWTTYWLQTGYRADLNLEKISRKLFTWHVERLILRHTQFIFLLIYYYDLDLEKRSRASRDDPFFLDGFVFLSKLTWLLKEERDWVGSDDCRLQYADDWTLRHGRFFIISEQNVNSIWYVWVTCRYFFHWLNKPWHVCSFLFPSVAV